MPRRLDYGDRGELVVEAVCRVVVRRGLDGLSLRAVAAEVDLSPSTLLHQYTDRARLFTVAAARVGVARCRSVAYRSTRDGVRAFVPVTEEERTLARTWYAFIELGRSDDIVGEVVALVRCEERDLLKRLSRRATDEVDLDALHAAVDGVVAAMFNRTDPVSQERAAAVVDTCARALGLPVGLPDVGRDVTSAS